MKAFELFDKIFAMDDEACKDAAQHLKNSINTIPKELSDEEFLFVMAHWAVSITCESGMKVFEEASKKYDKDQIATIRDIVEAAME